MENNSYEPDYSHGKSRVPATTQPAFPSHTTSSVEENRAFPPPSYTPYPNYYPDDIHAPPSYGQTYYPQMGPGYSAPVFVDRQGCEQPQPVSYMGQQRVLVASPVRVVVHVSMAGAIAVSCFVYLCCGIICGGIAFILAMIGQSSAAAGDIRGAIQLRNASYGSSIAGIVTGIIIIAVVLGINASVAVRRHGG